LGIGRQRHQPWVVDRTANGKVVQALKALPAQAEQVMKGVVEVTSDPSAADTGGLRFKVQHLPQQAGFPKQFSIPPCTCGTDAFGKFGNHAEAKGAGAGNLLMAAHHLCLLAEVSLDQFEQRQVLRAALWTFPQEVGTERGP